MIIRIGDKLFFKSYTGDWHHAKEKNPDSTAATGVVVLPSRASQQESAELESILEMQKANRERLDAQHQQEHARYCMAVDLQNAALKAGLPGLRTVEINDYDACASLAMVECAVMDALGAIDGGFYAQVHSPNPAAKDAEWAVFIRKVGPGGHCAGEDMYEGSTRAEALEKACRSIAKGKGNAIQGQEVRQQLQGKVPNADTGHTQD